jgi:hypothetical protein
VAEHHLDVWELLQSLQDQLRGLELLALHDEGVLGIILEDDVVELRHQRIRRAVPELENRRDQPDPRHVIGEPVLAQQIERRRMGGGGAGVGLRAVVLLEQPHRQAAATEQPRAQQPDRAAAGNQHALVIGRCHDACTPSWPGLSRPSTSFYQRSKRGCPAQGRA